MWNGHDTLHIDTKMIDLDLMRSWQGRCGDDGIFGGSGLQPQSHDDLNREASARLLTVPYFPFPFLETTSS